MSAGGYVSPASTAEVRARVEEARIAGRGVRVRGSGHSVDDAIAPPDGVTVLLLDRLKDLAIRPGPRGASAEVEVGAGCNLGYDRYDPTGTSSWELSLTDRLDNAGYALDCLGGISHQTVSGFLMTGSAGGSLVHDAGSNVVGLELVDGRGRVHRVRADDPDPAKRDLFEAAGVSMGLLGVVTRVWLRAVPHYDVIGREVTRALSSAPFDLCGRDASRADVVDLFRRHDYTRILWWPQPGFDRVQVWTGDRVPVGEEAEPFEILGRWDTLLGSLLQTAVGNARDLGVMPARLEQLEWFDHLARALTRITRADILHRPPDGSPRMPGLPPADAARVAAALRTALRHAFEARGTRAAGAALAPRLHALVGRLTGLFVPDGEKRFRDRWHLALPMDNQLDDRLWPTRFAELWVPLEKANEALRAVEAVARAGGDPEAQYVRNRAFPIEVYPGPPSRFWLSPGYGRAAVRINPCRFRQWEGEPDTAQLDAFLDVLRPFDPRPHWGKHLPPSDDAWRANLRRQLPRLDDFLRLRAELDPDGVFLTDYWRRNLGIAARGRATRMEATQ